MIFLDENAVRKNLQMAELIPAMERALVQFSTGEVVQPVRSGLSIDPPGGFLLPDFKLFLLNSFPRLPLFIFTELILGISAGIGPDIVECIRGYINDGAVRALETVRILHCFVCRGLSLQHFVVFFYPSLRRFMLC